MIPFPNKKYQIIYADPPWQYRKNTATPNRKIENHYPTMAIKDILELKVPADENCILYLWVTYPFLREGLEVIAAWGFEYKSCLVWDKETIGCGYWFRAQHELLLIGTKGKVSSPPVSMRVSSVYRAKREEHSKKPLRIKTWIEQWYPDELKIELFARIKYPGWDAWGNEVITLAEYIKRKKENEDKVLLSNFELGEQLNSSDFADLII